MARSKKVKEPFAINVAENWGGLIHPEKHTAAVGMRLCDNPSRDFHGFGDRRTIIGDHDVASQLLALLAKGKTWKDIKNNTRFSRSLEDRNSWGTTRRIGKDNDICVVLYANCAGEYCYVSAYADA